MFKAIKEFFAAKPAEVAATTAPYKVPEPEATTPIPLVTETASAEKLASAYNETYKVEDDHPGAVRRVPETVLEVSIQEVTAPVVETKVKEKAPAKAKAPKLTVVKSEKAPAKPKAEKAPAKPKAEKAPAKKKP